MRVAALVGLSYALFIGAYVLGQPMRHTRELFCLEYRWHGFCLPQPVPA